MGGEFCGAALPPFQAGHVVASRRKNGSKIAVSAAHVQHFTALALRRKNAHKNGVAAEGTALQRINRSAFGYRRIFSRCHSWAPNWTDRLRSFDYRTQVA